MRTDDWNEIFTNAAKWPELRIIYWKDYLHDRTRPNQAAEEFRQGLRFKLPPEYADCIANIATDWATLEHFINTAIWQVAGVYPAIGACLTSQIFTLDGRLKALLSLLKLRRADKDLIARVNKFSERLRGPLERRNRVVHDVWLGDPDTDEPLPHQIQIGARGVLTFGIEPVPIEKLREDRERVRAVMMQTDELAYAIEAALPSLPDIPLSELHPITEVPQPHLQTRSSDGTFLLFPPKPSPA